MGLLPYRFALQYDLNEDTADFIGHALALHRDDAYLDLPAITTGERCTPLHTHWSPRKLAEGAWVCGSNLSVLMKADSQ